MTFFIMMNSLFRAVLNQNRREERKETVGASASWHDLKQTHLGPLSPERDHYYPTVIFNDGIAAAVRLDISCRISDPLKYQFCKGDLLTTLSNLADQQFRQLIENFSFSEAKRKRRMVEQRLKKELGAQFGKYGIKLQSITIGAIQVRP